MGSILVAWHVAWSLDLYISSSLSSEVNCLGFAVLASSLVCAILAGLVSPTFSASLTACLISGSNYRRDHVLKEDAMALKQHHKSLEEYVQILEAIDEQHGSITVQPEELHCNCCRMRHCDLLTLAGY